ncbi:hypothetical protein CERSUDRAFT_157622 [Gelatoporia subvermispora B]|uniref:Uncharacterized protein n=1 Tax=Ceriporiopsis subvermispora (strain B) TaxID=914234 RepID=M2QCZ1_CERS8|nr:hypothetical protein CERSUDRAFT_157622 [Gelatoporia subvermispora B]
MKSFAIVAALVSVALAQSASPSLIPTGISSGCSSFLTTLNQDSSLSNCTTPIIQATSAFGAGADTTSTPSSSDVSSALSTLCGSSTCDSSTIRSTLADFYSACAAELTSSLNQDVLRTYDVLYSLAPLSEAICAKDDSGSYCVSSLGSSSTSPAPSATELESVAQNLWVSASSGSSDSSNTRRDQTPMAVVPNVTTYEANNLVFLFLNANLTEAQLCTPCARNIITSYISFESSTPYGPGLGSSQLLGGQSTLYEAVQSICGASFLSGAVQAAGGLSGGILKKSGAAPMASISNSGIVGTFVAAAALGVAALF